MQASDASRESRDSTPRFYSRRRRRDNELGQVLLRRGIIKPEQLREALRIQVESGGHVGAILKRMGACDSRAISEALIEQLHAARAKGKGRTLARRARENPAIGGLQVRCKPQLVSLALLAADLATLTPAAALVWVLAVHEALTLPQLFCIAGLVPLSLAALSAGRLHSVTPPSPPDEIRIATTAITLVYLGSWIVAALAGGGSPESAPIAAWIAGWAVAAAAVPSARGIVRWKLASRAWWGLPIVVLGAGRVGRAVVTTLQRRPQLGLKPVAILDDDPSKQGTVRAAWGEGDIVIEPVREIDDEIGTPSERSALEQFAEVEGVPVAGGLELAPALAQRLGVRTVVIALPAMDSAAVLGVIERFADSYTNVLVIPDVFNLALFGAPTRYLGGVLGIEVQRQLLLKGPRAAKRVMDILLTSLGLLLILPILIVIGLAIAFDSKGPVFYRQRRLGQDGVRFTAFKFRTMYEDAERRLQEMLSQDAALRTEYEVFHKLNADPRVTRVGHLLRKYSLDELPQLWNVVIGDMSLVGPRPYLEREIPDMAQKESIILRVKPGITGIWQVTWRNESTFEQRVVMDVEYVRSWSPWLDLYILARTVPVVIGGTGS